VADLRPDSIILAAETCEQILRAAEEVTTDVVRHYRHLHSRPELSWQEEETAAYVESVLGELSLQPHRYAKTGIWLELAEPAGAARRVLRADMDAIPQDEETGLPHTSTRPGVMHGCGHDAHTAMLLGAAAVLAKLEDSRPYPLRFIFQPAEEVSPSGAQAALEEGLLEGVGDSFSLHVWPHLAVGSIGVRSGVVAAAADRWECVLRGPGGHSARPYQTVDLLQLAARIIPALVDIPRTQLDPLRAPAVVTASSIQGGDAFNVLPTSVRLRGTVRTLDPEVEARVLQVMESTVRAFVQTAGASVDWVAWRSAPPLLNDAGLAAASETLVASLFGTEAIVPTEFPSLGSDDFAFFSEAVPSLYLRVGCRALGAEEHPLHSSRFSISEGALGVGVALLAGLAMMERPGRSK